MGGGFFLLLFLYRGEENGEMQTCPKYVMSNTVRHGCFTMHPGHIQVPCSFRYGCYRVTATASRTPASITPVYADEAAVSWQPGGGSVRPAAGRAITQRSGLLAGGTGLS